MVAVALFRKYGNDCDNERVFFYNQNVEVDFYIPEEELAIQVSYSIDKSDVTLNREVDALLGLADQFLDVLSDDGLSCLSLRMLIVSYKNPNSQSGIRLPEPTSVSSTAR